MRTRFLIVFVALVVSVAAGSSVGPPASAAPTSQPLIAYTSDRGGTHQLWTMATDGSSPQLVTPDAVSESSPVTWTTDGTRIGYGTATGYGATNPDGSDQFSISPAYDVVPSPDGMRITYLSSVDGCPAYSGTGCELVIAKTDGSSRVVLTAHSSGAVGWSPDGSRLAYEVRGNGAESEIWRASADGSHAEKLVTVPLGVGRLGIAWLADDSLVLVVGWDLPTHYFLYRPGDAAPTPLEPNAAGDSASVERSPDGTRFAVFASGSGSPQVINAYDLSGTRIARVSGGIRQPTWSPDGKGIVYGFCDFSLGQRPKGPCSVQVLDLTTGNTRNLLPGPDAEPVTPWYGGATWDPDGSRLAVSSLDETGKRGIKVVSADGASVTPITNGTANDTQPAWQPRPAAPPTGGGGGGGGGAADLRVTGGVEPASAGVGGTLTWRLRVLDDKNYGPATGVVIDVELPAGVTLESAQADRGQGCVPAGERKLRCNLDWLSSDAPSGNVTLVTTVTAPDELVMTATVGYSQADPVPADNTLVLKANTPTVQPPPPPVVKPPNVKPLFTKPLLRPLAPAAGKPFTFTLAVKRSDTRAPLKAGTLAGTPSLAGEPIRHTESFSGGRARLSLVIPKTAKGKQLTIKITITSGTQTTSRVFTYRVR